MLEIKNLKASANNRDILKGLNMTIKPGELHADWACKNLKTKS